MTIHISRAFSEKELRSRKNKKPYYLPISNKFDISILKDKLPEAFIFTNTYGKPYSSWYPSELWRRARVQVGETINLQSATRTSIASQCINAGIDKHIISKTLGHSDPRTVEKYAKMETQLLKCVVDGTGSHRQ